MVRAGGHREGSAHPRRQQVAAVAWDFDGRVRQRHHDCARLDATDSRIILRLRWRTGCRNGDDLERPDCYAAVCHGQHYKQHHTQDQKGLATRVAGTVEHRVPCKAGDVSMVCTDAARLGGKGAPRLEAAVSPSPAAAATLQSLPWTPGHAVRPGRRRAEAQQWPPP